MNLLHCLLFLPLFLTTALSAQQPKVNPLHTKIAPETLASLESHPGLVYARYGERKLELDLWRPKQAEKPLPAIVCIHGGG